MKNAVIRPSLEPVVHELWNNLLGLGDAICAFPVFKKMLEFQNHPQFPVRYIIYSHWKDFYRKFFPELHIVDIDKRVYSSFYKTDVWEGLVSFQPQLTTFRLHTVDYLFTTILGLTPEPLEKSYPRVSEQPFPARFYPLLQKKFALINVSHTWQTKRLSEEACITIAKYLRGREILPVFIGKKYDIKSGLNSVLDMKINLSDYGLDLTEKTELLEVLALLQRAIVFIGIDGGVTHLAGLTDIPIVAGYTIAKPEHKIPIRNGVVGYNCFPVTPDSGCQFCQYHLYDRPINASVCYFEDYACSLRGEQFIQKIQIALDRTI